MKEIEKVGIAGVGSLGSIVAKALKEGMEGYSLHAISDHKEKPEWGVPNVDFETLAAQCDVIVECLPPAAAPPLVRHALEMDKTLVLISSCALILYPEINEMAKNGRGRIIVPSGALSGLDGVAALAQSGITESKIISTKHPKGFKGAPYVVEKNIDLDSITEKFLIFSGNVREAAKAFPANVNVAASLALAGIGPDKTLVEVWADPTAAGNSHEIVVSGPSSTIRSRIDNVPDPANPKSSMQAGHSIVAALAKRHANLTIF